MCVHARPVCACVCLHRVCVCVSTGSSEKRGEKAERTHVKLAPTFRKLTSAHGTPGAEPAPPSGAAQPGTGAVSCQDVGGGVTETRKGGHTAKAVLLVLFLRMVEALQAKKGMWKALCKEKKRRVKFKVSWL